MLTLIKVYTTNITILKYVRNAMKKENDKNELTASSQALDLVLGESNRTKIYSHAVFCQCVLPVRSLPKEESFYQVQHGKTSLIIESGVLTDGEGKAHRMEVPAGAKARLLFPYIIDQAKRTGNPTIDMGASLREYMTRNNIPIGGQNAREITRQVRNIGASNIHLGMWGETETHKFSSNKNYRVASEVSFWTEKHPDQISIWNPYLTVSDEFMAAIESHCVLLDLPPLIALQANPRAMDIFTWLSYRIQTVGYKVKISYADLHTIFGKQTKELFNFKTEFKKAVKQALPYLPSAEVDLEEDTKHIILKNATRSVFLPSGKGAIEGSDNIIGKEGVFSAGHGAEIFAELEGIGLTAPVIGKLIKEHDIGAIQKAALVTKQSLDSGKVKNPAGFFTKALKEGWQPNIIDVGKDDNQPAIQYDPKQEMTIKPVEWRKVRGVLYETLGEALFMSWIHDVECEFCSDNEVVLKASGRFVAQTIENDYLNKIIQAWKQVTGKKPSISITVAKELAPA